MTLLPAVAMVAVRLAQHRRHSQQIQHSHGGLFSCSAIANPQHYDEFEDPAVSGSGGGGVMKPDRASQQLQVSGEYCDSCSCLSSAAALLSCPDALWHSANKAGLLAAGNDVAFANVC